MQQDSYYVYVYIDPRDYSEFYYGKGRGNRKDAHLTDNSDSEKARIIKQIKADGQEPIIRVIAKDLTESEAFLVEKTLIWKLGRTLSNVSPGKFKNRFRPHKTFHKEIPGFDFQRGVYFFNIGDVAASDWRYWEDMQKHSFIAAGGGSAYSGPIRTFQTGDIFCAYRTRRNNIGGYVGIGRIITPAVSYRKFTIRGRPLSRLSLSGNYAHDSHDSEVCDWICAVRWIKTVTTAKAKWVVNEGLFSKQMVKASLKDQPKTLRFLEDSFQVDFSKLLKQSNR